MLQSLCRTIQKNNHIKKQLVQILNTKDAYKRDGMIRSLAISLATANNVFLSNKDYKTLQDAIYDFIFNFKDKKEQKISMPEYLW